MGWRSGSLGFRRGSDGTQASVNMNVEFMTRHVGSSIDWLWEKLPCIGRDDLLENGYLRSVGDCLCRSMCLTVTICGSIGVTTYDR